MQDKTLEKCYVKWMEMTSVVILLVCAGLTLHDMQTAEGTGLYLSIRAGAESRLMYDLLVDVTGMLGLCALLVMPCFLLKRLCLDSILRFACACFAFLPVMSTASLVHLMDGTEGISVRQALYEGRIVEAMQEGSAGVLPVFVVDVPVLILAFAAVKRKAGQNGADTGLLSGTKGNRHILPKVWQGILVVQGLLLSAALLFPALADSCSYIIRYLLLICGFSLWERLYDEYPAMNAWGWILFGLFGLRGIERMLEVMSIYHI